MGGSDFKKNSVILGDAFLRGYYVYHDIADKKIGLYGEYMVYYGSKINWVLLLAFIGALSLIFLLLVVALIYFFC